MGQKEKEEQEKEKREEKEENEEKEGGDARRCREKYVSIANKSGRGGWEFFSEKFRSGISRACIYTQFEETCL